MSNVNRGKRLSILRSMTGLTCKAFANKYSIGYSTLLQWENGRLSGISKKGAEKVIRFAIREGVHCTLEWLFYGEGEPPSLAESINTENKPNSDESFDENDEILLNQEIEKFRLNYFHAITMIVPDKSMEPALFKGDYVGGVIKSKIKKIDEIEDIFLNKIFIIKTDRDNLFCKKFIKDNENKGKFISFKPEKSTHYISEKENIVSVALITRIWRKQY